MKLTRTELRNMINEETELMYYQQINEGAIENWATTLLGQAGIGDIAAGVKALTLDGGRLVSRMMTMYELLESYGDVSMDLGDSQGLEDVLANLSQAPVAAKANVKNAIYSVAQMMKTFLVSVVSASPDGLISTPAAAAITMLPIEKFFIEGARLYASFMSKIESLPGGKGIIWLAKLNAKIAQGPLGFFMADPLTMMVNLGRLADAASSQAALKDMASIVTDTGKIMSANPTTMSSLTGAPPSALPGPVVAPASPLTEARLIKLAGIK